MLLQKEVERSLFVALIGFCKYGTSDLDLEEGVCRKVPRIEEREVIKHVIGKQFTEIETLNRGYLRHA
jgi:hypothetical protein